MRWHSFHFHRLALRRFFTVFPLRPLTLLSTHRSPAKTLTYWHRPHTSKTRLPVLFVHGIGIGLYPYVNFLAQINQTKEDRAEDGEIGIIAIEIMPVSFRLTGAALEKDQLCGEVLQILQKHGWDKIVLVSHSYGTIQLSRFLCSRLISPKAVLCLRTYYITQRQPSWLGLSFLSTQCPFCCISQTWHSISHVGSQSLVQSFSYGTSPPWTKELPTPSAGGFSGAQTVYGNMI